MSYHYSDPSRENENHSLPDVEVFYVESYDSFFSCDTSECLSPGYYWWSCLPGCLPDSSPSGPFQTEDEALEDVRSVVNGD